MKKFPDWSKKTAIILFWLLLWQGAAMMIQNPIFLVGPLETLQALFIQAGSSEFWSAVCFSFGRICLGFFLALAGGLLTGTLSYWKPLIGEVLAPPLQCMKAVPVASFIILALIWTGAENLSVFISFMVVYPVIHVNTQAGLSSADPKLLEMARIFRVPIWKQTLYIYRIALYPYLRSGMKTALGMGMKSGIAAEVIGVPDGSIGAGLYMSKIYLSTADLFAWTLVIILISILFEQLFLALFMKTAGKGIAIYDHRRSEE